MNTRVRVALLGFAGAVAISATWWLLYHNVPSRTDPRIAKLAKRSHISLRDSATILAVFDDQKAKRPSSREHYEALKQAYLAGDSNTRFWCRIALRGLTDRAQRSEARLILKQHPMTDQQALEEFGNVLRLLPPRPARKPTAVDLAMHEVGQQHVTPQVLQTLIGGLDSPNSDGVMAAAGLEMATEQGRYPKTELLRLLGERIDRSSPSGAEFYVNLVANALGLGRSSSNDDSDENERLKGLQSSDSSLNTDERQFIERLFGQESGSGIVAGRVIARKKGLVPADRQWVLSGIDAQIKGSKGAVKQYWTFVRDSVVKRNP